MSGRHPENQNYNDRKQEKASLHQSETEAASNAPYNISHEGPILGAASSGAGRGLMTGPLTQVVSQLCQDKDTAFKPQGIVLRTAL